MRGAIVGRVWESWLIWLLRAVLVGVGIGLLTVGEESAALVVGVGLLLSFLPLAISILSRQPIPGLLALVWVLAVTLETLSQVLDLAGRIVIADKVVHLAELFLLTTVIALLLLGSVPIRRWHAAGSAVVVAALCGISLGVFWEFVEFTMDSFGLAHLQKSNADTMTDLLADTIGAILGAALAYWVGRHLLSAVEREGLGRVDQWLTPRLDGFASSHGTLVGIVLALLLAGIIGVSWLYGGQRIAP